MKSDFYAKERIFNLQILLSKLISLSGNPLLALSIIPLRLGFALSVTLHVKRNSSQVGVTLSVLFSLSEMSNSIILKISMVKA